MAEGGRTLDSIAIGQENWGIGRFGGRRQNSKSDGQGDEAVGSTGYLVGAWSRGHTSQSSGRQATDFEDEGGDGDACGKGVGMRRKSQESRRDKGAQGGTEEGSNSKWFAVVREANWSERERLTGGPAAWQLAARSFDFARDHQPSHHGPPFPCVLHSRRRPLRSALLPRYLLFCSLPGDSSFEIRPTTPPRCSSTTSGSKNRPGPTACPS